MSAPSLLPPGEHALSPSLPPPPLPSPPSALFPIAPPPPTPANLSLPICSLPGVPATSPLTASASASPAHDYHHLPVRLLLTPPAAQALPAPRGHPPPGPVCLLALRVVVLGRASGVALVRRARGPPHRGRGAAAPPPCAQAAPRIRRRRGRTSASAQACSAASDLFTPFLGDHIGASRYLFGLVLLHSSISVTTNQSFQCVFSLLSFIVSQMQWRFVLQLQRYATARLEMMVHSHGFRYCHWCSRFHEPRIGVS